MYVVALVPDTINADASYVGVPAPHSMVIWTMKQYEIPEKGENCESC